MGGVGADVLEDERARGGHNQHLQHEVVQRLKKDLAEGFGFDRLAIVVAEELSPGWEGISRDALGNIHFKLVTDAFDFYIPRETS